ncbi:hypothetical protein FISHEDRAFT_66171 [Fistulina hepatica ATCC 64428]|uniref:ABC transporter domain-containing protein n=1 Tax=Fistulina hepatica ATCC 64428 TaxID=1128425 RepID=A0A0D7A832_9AGAR|nr:hypothetical protein FISHEDRAFT_66171 [Fistulina hepatica ATCC 64428]
MESNPHHPHDNDSVEFFDPPGITERRRTLSRPHAAQFLESNPHHPHDNVSVEFFDPVGVTELRRTLSLPHAARLSVKASEATLNPGKGDEKNFSTVSEKKVLEEFDFEGTVHQVLQRREEANVPSRELGIVFEDLNVTGRGSDADYMPTFGSRINPLDALRGLWGMRNPHTRPILTGFEGVVRPGEMLLVLGSPGAGCTSFLKILANRREEYHAVDGKVEYDSLTHQQIASHYRGDVLYCPEDDVHFPSLTVEQTIKFAARCRAPKEHYRVGDDESYESREAYVDRVTDILLTVMGLQHARQTAVGDARIPLRIATDLTRMTSIVTLYQAGESLYRLFDKVCVINQGRMAYFGPAAEARDYFIDLGYEPANRQTTSDFLVSVTDPVSRRIFADYPASAMPPPRTPAEFAQRFLESPAAQANRADMEAYRARSVGKSSSAEAYRSSARDEHADHTRKASPYLISVPMQTRAVVLRRVQMTRGNPFATALSVFSFTYQGIIIGTVFFQSPDNTGHYFSRTGTLFFTLMFAAIVTMAEIPALFAQRPIVLRHRNWGWYHPFIESLALVLVDIPITLATTIVWGILLYFLAGLQKSAGQFFIYFLFVFIVSLTMKSFFRMLASMMPSVAPAQAVAGVTVLALSIYTGYSIPQPYMIGALKWITYLNPLRYGFEAIVTNEFQTLNGDRVDLVPSGAGYENVSLVNQVCTTVGSVPGQTYVNGLRFVELSYGYSWSHVWRNLGINLGFLFGFVSLLLIFTEINTRENSTNAMILFKRHTKRLVHTKLDEEEGFDSDSADAEFDPATGSYERRRALKVMEASGDVFTFQNMNYTVQLKGGESRRLLSDVSGYVVPGKLTALMGESGAGKTTLLNVLAQRVDSGVVSGVRLINGQPLPANFQAQTGYCQQMDTHLPTDTVREALLFSAKLRQPVSVPIEEKEAYVDKCLTICGLDEFRDAQVGSLGVELKKRVTIGVELAAKPKTLIWLDEPTTGLDAQSAWRIMTSLRELANQGQAILCTIHQPSAELFQIFDRILLLRKGGETVYHGDLGPSATTIINYFERNGARTCGIFENPAEYMLDVIGAGATARSVQDWHSIWTTSPEAEHVQAEIEAHKASGREREDALPEKTAEYITPWRYQVRQLIVRDFTCHWRDPTYLLAKLFLNVVSSIFIGFTFFKAADTQQGTTNKIFSLFMSTVISTGICNQLQVFFINMRTIYDIRERPSRMYSWTALLTSQIIAELPFNIIGSSLYFLCWYWTVGFPTDRAGFTYLMLGVIFPCYYMTLGQAVASMAPDGQTSNMIFGLLFSYIITFAGVLQPFPDLGWWKWMYWMSPYHYLIEGLIGQAVGHHSIHCSDVEYVTLNPPSGQTCSEYMATYISEFGGYLTNPDASSDCQFCSTDSADQYLQSHFNIFYGHHWRNVGILCGFIAFNSFAIYGLTWFCRIRRKSVAQLIKGAVKKTPE